MVWALLLAVWRLGALGLIAIGLSGVLSLALGETYGAGFISGDAPGVTYTPARCNDFSPGHRAGLTTGWG